MADARLKLPPHALGVLLVAAGCRAPEPVALAPVTIVHSAPGAVSLEAQGWQMVRSPRQGLEFPLPNRQSWAINDRQTPWLVAQHRPSRSELRVRSWPAVRLNTVEGCARQVRLWRPELPASSDPEVLESRALQAPEGYRGQVFVGVRLQPAATEGFVVAIGARTGRCLVFWYRTRVSGDAAATVVGENLAIVSERIVDQISEVAIDERVDRGPGLE